MDDHCLHITNLPSIRVFFGPVSADLTALESHALHIVTLRFTRRATFLKWHQLPVKKAFRSKIASDESTINRHVDVRSGATRHWSSQIFLSKVLKQFIDLMSPAWWLIISTHYSVVLFVSIIRVSGLFHPLYYLQVFSYYPVFHDAL